MKLDDHQFLVRINREAARAGRPLPPLASQSPETLRVWSRFLEACLRGGVTLSDERWGRVSVRSREPVTTFDLAKGDSRASGEDEDFLLGLQLLMGMLGDPQD